MFQQILVHFPKETHFQKLHETIYRDFAGLYKVVKVFKSTIIKNDSIIKVWKKPAIDEYLIELEHEKGTVKSPIQAFYASHFEVKDNEHIILFLDDNANFKEVFVFAGQEGLSASGELIKLLNKK